MSVAVSGGGVNEQYNPMATNPYANTNSPGGGPILTALVEGLNTITVPPNTGMVIIIPPATTVFTLTLKGVSGDTGITLQPGLVAMLPLAAGSTSLLLAASGPMNVSLLWL